MDESVLCLHVSVVRYVAVEEICSVPVVEFCKVVENIKKYNKGSKQTRESYV